MDQIILVVDSDILAGRRLVEALESDLQIEAAFWWLEDNRWKLILATPRVHEQGPRLVYSDILDVIESTTDLPRNLFERIEAVSPSAGVVTMFDLGADRTLPLGRFVVSESIRSVYVEGAYFYKFQPRTFAKAS
ncbi:MAG: hypothetical protein HY235_10285 [Acidobacteria bacterium]|nr:hypothetical protein [Acidobacteriota bacterium]